MLDQRPRTVALSGGALTPAIAAHTISGQVSAPSRATIASAMSALPYPTAKRGSHGLTPYRSINRPRIGASALAPIENDAITTPALRYEPVARCVVRITARPTIPKDNQPAHNATISRLTVGRPSRTR